MAKKPRKPRSRRQADSLRAKSVRQVPKSAGKKRGSGIPVSTLGPLITSGPDDWSGPEGDTAVFTVTATSQNASPMTYQWQYFNGLWFDSVDGGNVSGSQTDTLSIANVTEPMDGDMFRVKITNSATSVTSGTAKIIVTGVIYYLVTEPGDGMIDEPATNQIVDERSP